MGIDNGTVSHTGIDILVSQYHDPISRININGKLERNWNYTNVNIGSILSYHAFSYFGYCRSSVLW